jgi:tRNA A-37 threonylcarbamoyl transferase component Bud32
MESFDFAPGRILAKKYEVIDLLGAGWEGEVYRVREIQTDIERTAKFFFPQRNEKNKALLFYARKLHNLQHCPVVIQYHTQDQLTYRRQTVSFLISEFVEGDLLTNFLKNQPGKRLQPFTAIHLLYALAEGIEHIHALGEYHGDLHADNIIVQRFGLEFDLKLLDFYHWGASTKANRFDDVCDIIRIFYDALGGARTYAKQPAEVKDIVCGLKRSLIHKKFSTAGDLKLHLETMEFE